MELVNKSLTLEDIEVFEETGRQLDELFSEFNKEMCSKCSKFPDREGCCLDCNIANGYLKNLKYPKQVHILKARYGFYTNDKKGFHDTVSGCKLPRSKRSIICLRHCCNRDLELKAIEITRKLEIIQRTKGYYI